MSILLSKDEQDLIVSCACGCDESLRIKIDKSDDTFCYISYLNSTFYKEQEGCFSKLKIKLSKILCIIRNKDYCYSEIVMNRADWEEFKRWVNNQE